ncbi:ERF family protein [Paenibacillus illinoisensis]|uniref:ERF family protein n=1 Tax=Paenibacillus illinoisensis TaxID=59845 RepID=A0ABW8HZA5_9BACL
MQFSETNQSIAKGLVAAWGAIETPKHNTNVTVRTKTGGSYEFSYTDLDGIFEAIKNVFRDNKIAVIQNAHTDFDENGTAYVSVETTLLHESGEWVKSEPLKVIANQGMQDLGGQITYMKRYSLSAMLGIATEKDDDANGVAGNQVEYKNQQPRKLSEAQVKRLYAIAKAKDISAADVKKAIMKDYNKTQAEDLTKEEYDELCGRLEAAGKE